MNISTSHSWHSWLGRVHLYSVVFTLSVAFVGCASNDNLQPSPKATKIARIILAEDSRTITKELKELLPDPEPQIRARASRAVGRIGVDSAPLAEIDALLQANLHDSTAEVAAMTAFAYGLLPKDSTLANTLVEYAFTAPEQPALNAIVASGRLADSSDTQVIQKLMVLLNHPRASYRSRAALALFFCNAQSTIDGLNRVALSDSVKSVRDTALYALVRLRASRARDVYLAYLHDTDSYLQALALRGLIAVDDTTLAFRALPFLTAENVNLRSQAISTLGALPCSAARKGLRKTLVNEPDKRLTAQALRLLASFPGERKDILAEQYLVERHDLGLQSAAVIYLAGSFDGVLSPLLDSVLRNGNPQLLSAFFDGLSRDVTENAEKRKLFELCEEMLHAPQYRAPGPAYYSAYALYDDLKIQSPDWMSGKTLWRLITSDTDSVIKTAMLEYAGRRKTSWFFDVALPLARLIKNGKPIIQALEYQDVYRSLLSATESYVDRDIGNASEQTKLNLREIFETCLLANDFVVSKEAAEKMKRYFQEDVSNEVYKPQPRYDEQTLAQRLASAERLNKYITIRIDSGEVTIELDYDTGPLTCLNFLKLIEDGVYDNLVFHRVVPNFVAQAGDPRGDGWGGPGYSIRCEYSQRPYIRGAVGMATSGKDTGGSQFFITLSAQPHLYARYTVFGAVINGTDLTDKITRGDSGEILLRDGES